MKAQNLRRFGASIKIFQLLPPELLQKEEPFIFSHNDFPEKGRKYFFIGCW